MEFFKIDLASASMQGKGMLDVATVMLRFLKRHYLIIKSVVTKIQILKLSAIDKNQNREIIH